MIYTKNCFNSYFADLGMSEEGIWFGMLTCESCFLFELEPFIESVRPKEEKRRFYFKKYNYKRKYTEWTSELLEHKNRK